MVFKKGNIPWNKGKHHLQKEYHPLWGKERSKEVKGKLSLKMKGWHRNNKNKFINPMRGKKHSQESKKKIGLKSKELWRNPEFRKKVIENWLKGLIKRPTSLERKFIELIEKHNLPFKFCGDGSFLIGFKILTL